jgi:hypothetical protein
MSSLCSQDEARNIIESSNFKVDNWEDTTKKSLEFFKEMLRKTESSGPTPLGLHLLMGKTAKTKFLNQVRNLEENKISIAQGTAMKI